MQPSLPIRVLLIEDNAGDARLFREMIRDAGGGRFAVEIVDRLAPALAALERGGIGVVLLDLSLPDSAGLDTFCTVHGRFPEVPIVVLTGNDDETVAVRAVEEGAQDYLVKGRVEDYRLVHALWYALSRHQRLQRVVDELRTTSTSASPVRSSSDCSDGCPRPRRFRHLGNVVAPTRLEATC
jgi:DNA-binding response OmpR family regulator